MVDNRGFNHYDCKVKWYPVYHQGWGEIVKDSIKNQMYLYCCECETEWQNFILSG